MSATNRSRDQPLDPGLRVTNEERGCHQLSECRERGDFNGLGCMILLKFSFRPTCYCLLIASSRAFVRGRPYPMYMTRRRAIGTSFEILLLLAQQIASIRYSAFNSFTLTPSLRRRGLRAGFASPYLRLRPMGPMCHAMCRTHASMSSLDLA